MSEENDWMKRIQEENAHLKNQIRLLKENYELRLLLGQQCENNSQGQSLGPHTSPVFSDTGSLAKGAHYKAGKLLGSKDLRSHSASWQEDLTSSNPTSVSNKEDVQAQTTFSDDLPKGVSSSRISERQSYHHLGSAQDSSTDKIQLEAQAMPKKKRVWFSDVPATDKLKLHTFYLNDIEIAQNSKKNGRIVGEIAFQLDRRILAHVFPGITRLYGFTVSNIPEKIKQVSMKSLDGSVDEKKYRAMTQRYLDLTARLGKMGYRTEVHPVFSEFLINTYGILKQRPDLTANPVHNSPAELRKMVIDIVPSKFLGDTLLLLNCLCELSKEDHKALFAW
ncbi:speriolin-like protein isoform X2 [Hemicordylus capensis]|uniref:speriolin-like protein isoform X2 n=1 Tax=Hemicordylus capensis TaxID=884348 RepID=UPI0023038677|nr:speriolin-like protein isoform X2 [Hemicordylus capensis]